MKTVRSALLPAILLSALSACSGANDGSIPVTETDLAGASAEMLDADGKQHGSIGLNDDGDRIIIKGEITGLIPGQYGMHLHTAGQCDAPDFKSAGGHWNPTGRQHGVDNPGGAHAGDLGNIIVGDDGKAVVDVAVAGQHVLGADGLIDGDGAAIVVHSGPDDNLTDPSGNSGSRQLCGVVTPAG